MSLTKDVTSRETQANRIPVRNPAIGARRTGPGFRIPKTITMMRTAREKKNPLVPDQKISPRKTSVTVRGLRTLVHLNFYRTLSMTDDLEHSPFPGTIPHILVHGIWLGDTPVKAWSVEVSTNGQLLFTPLRSGVTVKCAAIDFIGSNGKEKRVIYLKLDLEDKSLAAQKGWMRYLESLQSCAGILKASSYLPPRENFRTITELCLRNMDVILQDDSGIPFRYFATGWEVRLFGSYHGPHYIFPSFGQPDLEKAYQEKTAGPLPFHYSYDRADNSRNMMLCRKISVK